MKIPNKINMAIAVILLFATPLMASTSMNFDNGCEIVLSNKKVTIKEGLENLAFNPEDQVLFKGETGETVAEYSGLATDGNSQRSWAKAVFDPEGFSPPHFHSERTEDYYITKCEDDKAIVTIDGKEHHLSAGQFITIPMKSVHQVQNLSMKMPLEIIVKCYPSWIFQDHIPAIEK